MRVFVIICLLITVSMSAIPLLVYDKTSPDDSEVQTTVQETESDTTQAPGYTSSAYMDDDIAVYSAAEGKVLNLKMRDYIIGAVSAEMPASYHVEALKAQALACLTYAVKTAGAEAANPTASLNGAALSTDSRVHQAYMSQKEMEERWGDGYTENYNKIAAAVDAVADKIIVYNSEAILALFHAISSGKTENAENIWGGSYPYLVPAESEGDVLSPKFSTTTIFTEKQFSEIVGKIEGVSLVKDASKWVGKPVLSDSGTVLSLEIGGKKLTGTQIRDYFDLRSPAFSLTYDKDGSFEFKVTGYGHGVGMSQYGADYMARQGASYEEIIKHYYAGVEIV